MDFTISYGLWKAVENLFSKSWAPLKAPMVTDDFNFWFCEIKKVGPSLKYNNSISVNERFCERGRPQSTSGLNKDQMFILLDNKQLFIENI